MRTSEGLTRLLTFIDAVVAIAVTLLVLPLVDVAAEAKTGDSVADLFHHHGGELFSFLLSFAVIAQYWSAHHQLFERVKSYDRFVVRVSLLWALTIVFLPFPTQLVADHGSRPQVALLYVGVLLVSSACLSLLSLHVARTPELHRDGVEQRAAIEAFATTAWCSVAFVLLLLFPRVSYYALLVLLLGGPTRRVVNRLRRRTPAPDAGTPDGGGPDGGGPDAGTLDAGGPDAGTPDVGYRA